MVSCVLKTLQEDIHVSPRIFQMSKGDFHVVEFSGVSITSGENIFPSEKVRPRNTNPPITSKLFRKVEIEVPEDIRD